jgi:hypothetical protein
MARSVPDHAKVNGDAVDRHKGLARQAWRSAREHQPLPLALVDKIWVDCLSAVAVAPEPAIQSRMLRRVETLFRLLNDQARWPRG